MRADWTFPPTASVFLTLSLRVPAAESVPKGMQSGQLLQAGAPAAGKGAGEQPLHHRSETEGLVWSGRRRCCGECVRVHVLSPVLCFVSLCFSLTLKSSK